MSFSFIVEKMIIKSITYCGRVLKEKFSFSVELSEKRLCLGEHGSHLLQSRVGEVLKVLSLGAHNVLQPVQRTGQLKATTRIITSLDQ